MRHEHRFCPNCATPLEWLSSLEDGGAKERLRCPACGWTHWNNPTPVLAAVIECADRDGRLLLAKNAAWKGNMFALITGFMEAGESPQEGVAREVAEETALQVDALNLIGVYDFQRMNQVIIAYRGGARRSDAVTRAGRIPAVRAAGCALLARRDRLCAGRLAAHARARAAVHGPARSQLTTRTTMEVQKEIDTRGLNCPLPILKAKKALADMASGQVLKVVATDPGSVRDFQAFARQTGNELVEQSSAGSEFTHYLRRR
jgi:TusA-related sulfurtransferase/8-oxo-dGTP pyrophosphatase MutT (NUDIX family)